MAKLGAGDFPFCFSLELKQVGRNKVGSAEVLVARRDSRLVGKRSGAADWRNFVAVRWRKLSFSRPWREKREILGFELGIAPRKTRWMSSQSLFARESRDSGEFDRVVGNTQERIK